MKKSAQTGVLTGKSEVKNDVTFGIGMMPISARQIPLNLRYLERVKF